MPSLDELLAYGWIAILALTTLNIAAWLLWPRRTRPTPVPDDEVHGDVPHVGER